MALNEYGIECIGKVWGLDKCETPFSYAERVLEWHYAPTHHLRRGYAFRFVLVRKDDRFYKWVPNSDWDTIRAWLRDQAESLKYIYRRETYNVLGSHNMFEESDIEIVVYQLKRLQQSLQHVHRKTVGRLLRRGVVVESNGIIVVSEAYMNGRNKVYGREPRGHREGLNGIGNHNKPTRETYAQRVQRRGYQYNYRTGLTWAEYYAKEAEKKAKAEHDEMLLQKKVEHRAKIAAKKKNRKYNRAVIKNREQHGQDYIWW